MSDEAVPDGFARHFRQSPPTDPWEPLWSRHADPMFSLGLTLRPPHTNSRGMAHGGLIAALADNGMGLSCSLAGGDQRRLVTVNLAVDLLGTATLGDWVQWDCMPVKLGRSLCFAECRVTAAGKTIARANATFSVSG